MTTNHTKAVEEIIDEAFDVPETIKILKKNGFPNTASEYDKGKFEAIEAISSYIQEVERKARISENQHWHDWAVYPPDNANFIGIQHAMGVVGAVKDIKEHATERIKELERGE